jgi:hypothetical protein
VLDPVFDQTVELFNALNEHNGFERRDFFGLQNECEKRDCLHKGFCHSQLGVPEGTVSGRNALHAKFCVLEGAVLGQHLLLLAVRAHHEQPLQRALRMHVHLVLRFD